MEKRLLNFPKTGNQEFLSLGSYVTTYIGKHRLKFFMKENYYSLDCVHKITVFQSAVIEFAFYIMIGMLVWKALRNGTLHCIQLISLTLLGPVLIKITTVLANIDNTRPLLILNN